jgi:hypothetical protein
MVPLESVSIGQTMRSMMILAQLPGGGGAVEVAVVGLPVALDEGVL